MEEILRLKQQLLRGNYEYAIKIVAELEMISRQDKLNSLETFLLIIISHLIAIQISSEGTVYMSNVNQIQTSLLEIQERNRLIDSYYIKADGWQKHFENKKSRAVLLALQTEEICNDMTLEQLQQSIDFELLLQETLELVGLTYSKDAYEITQYLRDKWGEQGFHFY